ncbi:precorrin-3B synthase [Phytohabitans aurantiacus]|uniref:Precorrin-3B synthase n=1 Tax=Phytohabitans aurantiacus TaxID=3016789 RepID=A0ABQ5QRR9_9ACTN|nr:precorrin-3B synthase [Phytohabitans aurantiacus]
MLRPVVSPITPRRQHADACPGVLQVHAAADGGLARVRIPGGWLTGAQLAAVASAGNGLEITSRGNLQVRGLAPGAETAFAAVLSEAGLLPSTTHERVRNIVASPLTGRDGHGVLDARPLVAELDRALCADPVLADLPGRFLFALDDGRGDVAGLGADVAIHGTAVLLAGRDSGLRVQPADAVPVLLAAAHAFLAERGDEWRLSELDSGPGRVARRLGGSIGAPVSVSGRPPIGVIDQVDGRVAIGAAVPLGRLTPEQISVLSGQSWVCVTPWRGVVLADLPDADLVESLVAAGFAVEPGSPWAGVTACAGRPGCARSLADVRADALAFHSGRPAPSLPVHWAGCERACGRPTGAHELKLATEDGYESR